MGKITEEQQLMNEQIEIQNNIMKEQLKQIKLRNCNMFKDKTIVVFGGTGSLGSLIVEYLLTQKPLSIRVFALSENSIWELQQKLGKQPLLRYLKGDIRNLERVRMATRGCDYAFNAAAVKHVPIAEYNPMEAVSININGLNNIITACVECNVKKLLHISTDKAVSPETLMGATKLIGERLVQIRNYQHPTIDMVIVRLGNVYGSRGSFVQVIRNCVKENKPIPITNNGMSRYFITPKEAISFIIKAFINGKDGEIWVPDLVMKSIESVIKDELGDLFEKYSIVEIGKRKGEKLLEKLLTDDELNEAEYVNDNKPYWVIKNKFEV